tara:strand:+ start:52 stop:261 length:210 start_codon:yes stop_codon:yes gene_type:complete
VTGPSFLYVVKKRHDGIICQSKNEQGVTKRHDAKMLQSKNEQGVQKRHDGIIEQIDTLLDTMHTSYRAY